MKKAVISTYTHWNSIGSILQSVGLQQALKKIDVEPRTIVFTSDENVPAVKRCDLCFNASYIIHIYRLLKRDKLENGRNKALEFIDKYINKKVFDNPECVHFNDGDADVYIAGSDQIWHPNLRRDDFFLSYAPNGKKRISYAASMGVLCIPDQNRDRFREFIAKFDAISVREIDMIPVISNFTSKSVLQHIDPSFLISADSWRNYGREYDVSKPYVLVYALYWDRSLNQQLKELHKNTGLEIISIQSSLRPIYANRVALNVGPDEFLWLIDHAEGVVTSSFHGTALSIIMNKRLCSIVNPSSPSRISSLMRTLNVDGAKSIRELLTYELDYKTTNKRIEKEQQRGYEYLKGEIL